MAVAMAISWLVVHRVVIECCGPVSWWCVPVCVIRCKALADVGLGGVDPVAQPVTQCNPLHFHPELCTWRNRSASVQQLVSTYRRTGVYRPTVQSLKFDG